jgi:Protein of unknown function (DUF1353)
MSKFLTELDADLREDSDEIWVVKSPLVYQSDVLQATFTVPAGFQTDFASVPRLPFIYMAFGDRAHREAVLHDYLYRSDSIPVVTFDQANKVFYEAMVVRGKSFIVRHCMYWGVCLGGRPSFHVRKVDDPF